MAIAEWMESHDVYPGIEAAVRRTEAIETAAKAIDSLIAQDSPEWRTGSLRVDVELFFALRRALRGEA